MITDPEMQEFVDDLRRRAMKYSLRKGSTIYPPKEAHLLIIHGLLYVVTTTERDQAFHVLRVKADGSLRRLTNAPLEVYSFLEGRSPMGVQIIPTELPLKS